LGGRIKNFAPNIIDFHSTKTRLRNLFRNRLPLIGLCSLIVLIWPCELFSQDLDALLDLDMTELMEVQVLSASKIFQKIKYVPATVRVVTHGQIKERGYFTLDEALSDLPGFQFRNPQSLNSYVFLRAVPSQNNLLLIFIDGIQINELNSGGFYGGGQYNLSNVERIEVVYGPASILYGTNAISGIVDIITKKPDKGDRIEGNVLLGSFNTWQGDLSYSYSHPSEPFGIRISTMAKSSDKADLAGEAGDKNWTDELENVENDYALDIGVDYKEIQFGINYQNKQTTMSTFYPSVGTSYLDHGTYWNVRFLNTYLKHRYSLNGKSDVLNKVYFRDATVINNSIITVLDTAQIGVHRPNHLLGYEGMYTYIHRGLQLNSGLIVEQEQLAGGFSRSYSNSGSIKPPIPPAPDMVENSLACLYVQAQYAFLPSLSLSSGVRFDKSSYYGKVLTPRIALIYSKEKITMKTIYAEGFRAPKPWDFYDGLGNNDLDPEKIKSFEINTNYYNNKGLRADLSVYRNTLFNVFTQKFIGEDWQWINQGYLRTIGSEFTTEYRTANYQAYLNFTYNDSYDEHGNKIAEIADQSANAGLSYQVSNHFKFNLRANYIGRKKNPSLISATGSHYIDSASIFHGSITYEDFYGMTLQATVKNLFDTEYYHSSNRSVERYRQAQRTFLFNIGYHF